MPMKAQMPSTTTSAAMIRPPVWEPSHSIQDLRMEINRARPVALERRPAGVRLVIHHARGQAVIFAVGAEHVIAGRPVPPAPKGGVGGHARTHGGGGLG